MHRDRSNSKMRLLGLGMIVVGLTILAYFIHNHGKVVVVLGLVIVAVALAGSARVGLDERDKRSGEASSGPSALSRSFGRWWRS